MSLFDTITSLFAPDECLSCRREGSLLCDACSLHLRRPPGLCFGCYEVVEGVVCDDCLHQSKCASMYAAAAYEGPAKQLVASLKFLGSQAAAKIMAGHMLAVNCPVVSASLITHVPATSQHIRRRGYDQAALLAHHIAKATHCPRATLLARTGKQHQLGADRRVRLGQLTSSMRVRQADLVRGRTILLVDDVLTTGSSVRAATAALMGAGAARVDVLVFAQSIRVTGIA